MDINKKRIYAKREDILRFFGRLEAECMANSKNIQSSLQLAHLLGKKWTIPLMELFLSSKYSELHFNYLQERISCITAHNLSKELDDLRAAGLIERHEREPGCPAYTLTRSGQAFQTLIRDVKEFGITYYGINPLCRNKLCIDCTHFKMHFCSPAILTNTALLK